MIPRQRLQYEEELIAVAHALVAPGKGILAADESTGTIGKRFSDISLENNETNRAVYRDLLFTTAGLKEHISGCILYEETLFQDAPKGGKVVDTLTKEGIILGIKVDKGLASLGNGEEKATMGIEGLAERCRKYRAAGCRFAKWRCVLQIDPTREMPSEMSISETALGLARYASICQAEGLVPIIEPETLADGAHGIEVCAEVTERVLAACFAACRQQNVLLEGALLKPNMVTFGNDYDHSKGGTLALYAAKTAAHGKCPTPIDTAKYVHSYKIDGSHVPSELIALNEGQKDLKEMIHTLTAYYTVRTLRRTVPMALAGVVFLSGGQSELDATLNLNRINQIYAQERPCQLTFSFGRALQASTLKAWMGQPGNVAKAQKTLLERAADNGKAQKGAIQAGDSHGSAQTASLFEKKYIY